MQYPESIQTALEYIEQNLKAEVTAEELARQAHYSTFYFCRLFSSAVGSPVAGYILKRRLNHALAEIAGAEKPSTSCSSMGLQPTRGFTSPSSGCTAALRGIICGWTKNARRLQGRRQRWFPGRNCEKF